MPTNYTSNYRLNQWERSDKVLMDDFNADNAKLDAALKAEADARTAATAALAAQVALKGNCRMETSRYTGDGTCGADHPTKFSFSGRPAFFIIHGSRSAALGDGLNSRITLITYSNEQNHSFGAYTLGFTWTGNQFSLVSEYAESQLNRANAAYHVVAFYKQS